MYQVPAISTTQHVLVHSLVISASDLGCQQAFKAWAARRQLELRHYKRDGQLNDIDVPQKPQRRATTSNNVLQYISNVSDEPNQVSVRRMPQERACPSQTHPESNRSNR